MAASSKINQILSQFSLEQAKTVKKKKLYVTHDFGPRPISKRNSTTMIETRIYTELKVTRPTPCKATAIL